MADETTDPLAAIAELPTPAERLVAYGALARTADPPTAVRARVAEIGAARELGRQQHAVVAGSELIGLLDTLPAGTPPIRGISRGLAGAAHAALDLPEIPLSVVDELLLVMERVLRAAGRIPYAVWEIEARRHSIAGDEEAVRERVARLAPHVSRTNHARHEWRCPGCVLCSLTLYVEATDPEVVGGILGPLVSGGPVDWRDDPELVPVLDQWYGGKPCCDPSRHEAHALHARALIHAGRVAEARTELAAARRYDAGGRSLWVPLVELELALAEDDPEALARAVEPVLDLHRGHEDAYEAVDLAVAAARGLSRLGDPRASAPRQQALADAARLDRRIERPRHVAAVERALGPG